MKRPKLVAMTVWNRATVPNAFEVFEASKDLDVDGWGCKDVGIPLEDVAKLLKLMKETNKFVVLELMRATEEEWLDSTRMAIECGIDAAVGGKFSEKVAELCQESGIEYYPFIRKNEGELDISKMVNEAVRACEGGATGVCVPFYGVLSEPTELIEAMLEKVKKPIISAAAINCRERLLEMSKYNIDYLNIGSSFFEKNYVPGGSYKENVQQCINLLDEINNN